MSIINTLGGVMSDDVTVGGTPTKVESRAIAFGAIPVGAWVQLAGADTSMQKVAAGAVSTTLDHTVVGVFEGKGDARGAVATVAGTTGRAALSGDRIVITIHGRAMALVQGLTTAIADRDFLIGDTNAAGALIGGGAAATAGLQVQFIALQAVTLNGGAVPVRVACM